MQGGVSNERDVRRRSEGEGGQVAGSEGGVPRIGRGFDVSSGTRTRSEKGSNSAWPKLLFSVESHPSHVEVSRCAQVVMAGGRGAED